MARARRRDVWMCRSCTQGSVTRQYRSRSGVSPSGSTAATWITSNGYTRVNSSRSFIGFNEAATRWSHPIVSGNRELADYAHRRFEAA